MYTALPAHGRDTPGRIATLLLGWHAMGQERVHFLTSQDALDGQVWVLVSTSEPRGHVSDAFIYPEDLHPNTDPDVCAKIARLYAGIPVGGQASARLRVRSAVGAGPAAAHWSRRFSPTPVAA